jgi:hypothetical protein
MFYGLVTRHLHDEDDISLHNVGNNPGMRRHIEHRKPQQSTYLRQEIFMLLRKSKFRPPKIPLPDPVY